MQRAAMVFQFVTLFFAAWFIASPDHPLLVAAAAVVSGGVSLLLLSMDRRGRR